MDWPVFAAWVFFLFVVIYLATTMPTTPNPFCPICSKYTPHYEGQCLRCAEAERVLNQAAPAAWDFEGKLTPRRITCVKCGVESTTGNLVIGGTCTDCFTRGAESASRPKIADPVGQPLPPDSLGGFLASRKVDLSL